MPVLYNLREYHRPDALNEAVRLLQREDIKTVALAGGVSVVGEGNPDIEAVVDLSGLGLDFIEQENNTLLVGSMVPLQAIVEKLGDVAGGLLTETARRMAGPNLRNRATLGGLLAGGDLHSSLSVALAALKARVKIYGQSGEMPLWLDLASDMHLKGLEGQLITAAVIGQVDNIIGASYEQVARTSADRPIVCAASVAYRASNGTVETSTSVGGLLRDRLITVSHTLTSKAISTAIEAVIDKIVPYDVPESAYLSDFLGSAEYRRHMAPILAQRALNKALSTIDVAPST